MWKSNNLSGFLCHVTVYFSSNYFTDYINPLFDTFLSLVKCSFCYENFKKNIETSMYYFYGEEFLYWCLTFAYFKF